MYSRQLIKAPKKIVQNGKIQFGSFFGVSDTVDIRGVKAPFAGVPTSTFFSNFRIKSRIAFAFAVDNYIGLAEFFDDKAFGLAEVIFWDKETENAPDENPGRLVYKKGRFRRSGLVMYF